MVLCILLSLGWGGGQRREGEGRVFCSNATHSTGRDKIVIIVSLTSVSLTYLAIYGNRKKGRPSSTVASVLRRMYICSETSVKSGDGNKILSIRAEIVGYCNLSHL